MKKQVFAVAALSVLSQIASAQDYIQVDLTQVTASDVCDGIPSGLSCDDTDNGFRIAYGHNFNENVGIQFGYQDGGQAEASYSYSDSSFSESEKITGDFSAFDVTAVGTIPLSESNKLYGRIGFARWKTKLKDRYSYSEPGFDYQDSYSNSESGSTLTYGVGAQFGWFTLGYDIVKDVELDDTLLDKGDVERLSIGANIAF